MNGLFFPLAAKRRRSAGGGSPAPQSPDCTTPAVLALSGDNNSLIYTEGVWTGVPAPTVTAVLNIVGGPSGIPVVPGAIPIDPAWRGRSATILEDGDNGVPPGFQQVSNSVAVPAAPSLDQQVLDILAGTPGFRIDPRNLATMFQDTAGTIPVTAEGQPVARINTEGGTTSNVYQNPTVTAQPLFSAPGYFLGDGVDDLLGGPTPWAFNNMDACFVSFEVEFVTLPAGTEGLWGFSNNQTVFLQFTVSANGSCTLALFSGLGNPPASAAGVFVAGQKRVVTLVADWTTEGRYEVYVDGLLVTSIVNGPLPPQVHSNANRHRILSTIANTVAAANAKMGRLVLSNQLMTLTERQTIEAWVGESFEPTPEEALVALFATKRLGYVVDPRDKSTMLQAGSVPVTTDGQSLARVNPGLVSAATAISWTNGTVGTQPIWVDDAIVPDGVDDVIFFPSGGTAVQPDFGNLAGFVASILVTPGPLQLQTIWSIGFGGTNTNNRLTIQGLANGAAQFTVNDEVARRVFATPAGLLIPGTPVLLTLFVDFQTREAKGFVDGVERGSFTLLNTTDIVNVDSNRCSLFRSHGSGEFSNCKLHRAAFLHDRTDASGRITMEAWVSEGPFDPPPPPPPAAAWRRPEDFSTLPPDSKVVAHNGRNWRNISLTPNVWEPGIFGWEAAE